MTTAILIIAGVAILIYAVMLTIFVVKKKKHNAELEKQRADLIEKARKKNEQKEQMESGDNKHDFNASVDILHDLAKK